MTIPGKKDHEELAWNQISKTTPDTLHIEMEISGKQIEIELRRKNDLLASSFSSENVLDINGDVEDGLEHRLVDAFHLHCHYSGFVVGDRDSHVTLSICDGMVSLFSTYRNFKCREHFWTFLECYTRRSIGRGAP